MGTIAAINRHPKTWPVTDTGLRTSVKYGSIPLVKVTYGTIEDAMGEADRSIYMRKEIYDKLIDGTYVVSHAGSDLCIIDRKTCQPIAPLKEDFCY